MNRMFFLVLSAVGVVVAEAGVNCRVEPDYGVREADKPGTAYVKVTLAADKVAAKSRPSANLAIVLDRSGSMHGAAIERAREAACEAVKRLDERDIISVVAYDDVTETVVPAQRVVDREGIIAKIRRIEARGMTALFAGVAAGASELAKFRSKCEISRVLLLSDGQANVGPSTAEELGRYGAMLMKDGIAVSTVGLGNGYNEDLMTRLSQKSDGNSYYVADSKGLTKVFASELGDVLSVAATKVQLKVRFGEGFVPVQLVGRDGRIADGVVTIDLNQLYGGQEKYVIVKCDAAPGKAGDAREIAKAEVSYDDATSGGQRVATGVAAVTYSTDAAAVAASVNRNVVKERVLNENALRLEGAIRAADKGDFENAQRLIRESQAAVEDVGRSVDGMEELMQEEMDTQARNAAEFKSRNWSGSVRKRARTKSFQLFNQQISK